MGEGIRWAAWWVIVLPREYDVFDLSNPQVTRARTCTNPRPCITSEVCQLIAQNVTETADSGIGVVGIAAGEQHSLFLSGPGPDFTHRMYFSGPRSSFSLQFNLQVRLPSLMEA